MASNEFPKQIVRTEYDPSAGTAEGEILVCEDGSRWRVCLFATESTTTKIGRVEGNQIQRK